jgi:hypothetical protein
MRHSRKVNHMSTFTISPATYNRIPSPKPGLSSVTSLHSPEAQGRKARLGAALDSSEQQLRLLHEKMSTDGWNAHGLPNSLGQLHFQAKEEKRELLKTQLVHRMSRFESRSKCTDAGNTTIDATVLIDLFRDTRGGTWILKSNWLVVNSSVSVCNWSGIGCDACGRVSRINLSQNNISGTLPMSLRDLVAVEMVDFSRNPSLSGTLEPDFSRWTAVTLVDLSFTSMSGQSSAHPDAEGSVRSFGTCRFTTHAMGHLDGPSNPRSVALPCRRHGTFLECAPNQSCIAGYLTPECAAWTQLTYLDLSASSLSASQRISGNLSDSFSSWRFLQFFAAENTMLSGTLSTGFSSWLDLRWLSLANTKISGTLSPSFQLWFRLSVLDLSSTSLSGALDTGFAQWREIDTISLVLLRCGPYGAKRSACMQSQTPMTTLFLSDEWFSIRVILMANMYAYSSLQSDNTDVFLLSAPFSNWTKLETLSFVGAHAVLLLQCLTRMPGKHSSRRRAQRAGQLVNGDDRCPVWHINVRHPFSLHVVVDEYATLCDGHSPARDVALCSNYRTCSILRSCPARSIHRSPPGLS